MTPQVMADFELGRKQLTKLVLDESAKITAKYGVGFRADSDAPSTYEGILEEYLDMRHGGKPFRVSPDSCDNSVFTMREANHACRHWHDVLHAERRHDLSYHGELMVAYEHLAVVARAYGECSPPHRLMKIDTIDQLVHYHTTGNFVANQLEFAKEQFLKTIYTTTPMSVDGKQGYAVQRTRNGEVRFFGGVLGIHIMHCRQAEDKVGTLTSLLPLLGPESDWVERKGAHSDSKKPCGGYPPGASAYRTPFTSEVWQPSE